jgi:steroid 5-alpha reductase family enzyme
MSEFAGQAFAGALPWIAGAVAVVAVAAFAAAKAAGRWNVVDTAWGLFFVAAGLAAMIASAGHGDPGRRWLLLGMVSVWGLRLAVHVGRRSVGKGEDPRYTELLNRGAASPTVNAIVKVFVPQAILAFLISAPLQAGPFESGPLGVVAVAGVLIWAIGLFFETVGDAQMERYKAWKRAQPKDRVRASVMDQGLWRLTRHPNYFGDACVWWGIFLVAAEHWPGVVTIFGPLIMTFLLTQGSGKRNLERSMVKRPGYPEYMKRTSGFFPWPPKTEPAGPAADRPDPADISVLRGRPGMASR